MQVQGTTTFPDFAVFTSLLTVSSLGFSVSLLGLCKVAVTILKAKMFYERKKKKFSHLKKYIYCKGLYLIVNLNTPTPPGGEPFNVAGAKINVNSSTHRHLRPAVS